jgi:hypothetical protein
LIRFPDFLAQGKSKFIDGVTNVRGRTNYQSWMHEQRIQESIHSTPSTRKGRRMKLQIAAVSTLLLLASAASHSQDATSLPISKQEVKKRSVVTDRRGKPISSRYHSAEKATGKERVAPMGAAYR